MSHLTVGRIVQYRLNAGDIDRIQRPGPVPRPINSTMVGDVVAAMVVRVFAGGLANLQVFYDGDMTDGPLWATSRRYSADGEPGTWAWPERV